VPPSPKASSCTSLGQKRIANNFGVLNNRIPSLRGGALTSGKIHACKSIDKVLYFTPFTPLPQISSVVNSSCPSSNMAARILPTGKPTRRSLEMLQLGHSLYIVCTLHTVIPRHFHPSWPQQWKTPHPLLHKSVHLMAHTSALQNVLSRLPVQSMLTATDHIA
jgi:hypothetical protein